jgi:hypothetical protein
MYELKKEYKGKVISLASCPFTIDGDFLSRPNAAELIDKYPALQKYFTKKRTLKNEHETDGPSSSST